MTDNPTENPETKDLQTAEMTVSQPESASEKKAHPRDRHRSAASDRVDCWSGLSCAG